MSAAFSPIPARPGTKLSLLIVIVAVLSAFSAAENRPDLYAQAMAETRTNSRILGMQDFLASGNTGSRKLDALEVLVWDYKQLGNQQKASEWAGKLLDADPNNPLALAVLADSARYNSQRSLDENMARSLDLALRGLKQQGAIRPPDAMLATEFVRMQSAVNGWLNGAAGFASVHRLDFLTARAYLRKAVQSEPQNPQYVYELALADLMGKQQEPKEGFLYLAKAVNLTQGTPAGEQIAAFAAARYQRAGGTAQNWTQYLVATAVPGRAPALAAASSAPTTPTSIVAANQAANESPKQQPLPQSSAPQQQKPTKAEGTKSANNHISEEQIAATLAPPPLPPAQTVPKPIARPGAPVSLGILMEASINNRENRRSVTYALTDLVRHLGQNDEAFILSFSHDLVFEQDLTSNYDYLRDAVESIRPQSGAALLDAVAFASGHLDRIARNGSNRVLLVVSDGKDINSRSSPYDVTGAIDSSGVKLYCIGLGIDDPANRSRLQALAARSGGRAVFAEPSSFRVAAHDIAAGLGIDFPR